MTTIGGRHHGRSWRRGPVDPALAVALCLLAGTPVAARDLAAIVAPTTDFTKPEPFERNPGGATTHKKAINGDAFSHPSANLPFERRADFFIGNGFFKRSWVTAPASTGSADGLGPLFNARSCQGCHLKDGRGHPPSGPDEPAVSMFLRLSVPAAMPDQAEALAGHRINVVAEPTYGTQLQNLAVPGLAAEGRMVIDYRPLPVALAGGERVLLRQPAYRIADLGYGPLAPGTMLSPRVAPPMLGLGLLEAIDEADILALADPDDADGDSVSGRPNRVWSLEQDRVMLGRFGWKAGTPTVMQQSSEAMAGDIGISNPLAPFPHGDCTKAEVACVQAPTGEEPGTGEPEAAAEVMTKILFYARNLALPVRRDIADPTVLQGKRLFYESGCIACHRPKFITRKNAAEPAQSFQLIWPYSDLLLHDMGEGLADGRPEGVANGREWRTPPLWGIGLTETVNGHSFFLHDGRARDLTEAILWHGGEAQAARDRFAAMAAEDRTALLTFLRSL